VGNGPTGVALGAGAVWVANNTDGSVSRIDPRDLSVTTTRIAPGAGTYGVAVQGPDVWVSNEYGGSLTRLDATTQRVTRTIPTHGAPLGLAFVGDRLWFTNAGGGAGLHRGGTLRLASTGLDFAEDRAVLDPFDSYDFPTWWLLALTNDGLVGFRRAPGAQGLLPVPDLATSLPAPTDGGLTYAFTLRSGVRYSTGEIVKAGDVRRGLERTLRGSGSPAFLYGAIRGADGCSAKAATCDLSRGVVTDDATGAVTIHLTRPDPALVYKLALPSASAVPVGVPFPTPAGRAFPATGPYMVKAFLPKRADAKGVTTRRGRILLVRNPRFTEWSAAAQPDGYVDEIDLETGWTAAQVVARVTDGRADAAWPYLDPGEAGVLRATRAAQVHTSVQPTATYVFLNTQVAPFDNRDARRAVAYALDRGDLASGTDAFTSGQVTCQVLPPDFPGYRPYCPYTLGEDTSHWRAPDLRKALGLVAASHTRGARVTFFYLDDPGWFKTARKIGTALTGLGYRVTLKGLPQDRYFDYVSDSRRRAQAGLTGWTADYPAASTFLDNLASCASFRTANPKENTNYGEYCDAAIDAEIRRALQLQAEDAGSAVATWAAVDRAVTDDAALVPLSNQTQSDLVGRRVGNYQANVQLGMLLSRLWVQ
jgi:peptide/nickel transport system substrate-binding protein